MGYFAEDFDTAFEQVRSQRAVVLRAPVQSTYSAPRIAFLSTPNSAVIEVMERRH